MPSQGSRVRRLMKGGLEQTKPPRLGADNGFFHLNRSADGGGGSAAPHLLTGGKAVVVNCVAIHFLVV